MYGRFWVFIVYPGTSLTTLQTFMCTKIADTAYLTADFKEWCVCRVCVLARARACASASMANDRGAFVHASYCACLCTNPHADES
jgi:hypothetical protein